MKITIIAAIITGACTIVAAIIAAIVSIYQSKTNKRRNIEDNFSFEIADEYIEIPAPKHPILLNPNEYDIEDENYFITLGGLLQQSRNPKDVTMKKINKEK